MEYGFMNSFDPDSTEHRRSPGTPYSAGRFHSSNRPVSNIRFIALLLLAAFLVLLPVASAAGEVSPEDTALAVGNAPVEENATATGNVTLAGNPSMTDTRAQEAPEETITPEEPVTPEVTGTPAVNTTKEYVDDLMFRGADCYTKHDFTCAWDYYEAAHQADPGRWAPLYVESLILANKGNTTGAIGKMDEVLVLLPNSASMWKFKGDLLNSAGRYAESDACYDRALEINPRISIPLANRFPYNLGMKNLMLIVITVGFLVLGIYIFFREFRQ
jgi:hypothetical protein